MAVFTRQSRLSVKEDMIRKATFTLAFAAAATLAALPLLPSQAEGAKAHPAAKADQSADDQSKFSRIMAAALAD